MKTTLLLHIDTGDDTDLLAICDEVREVVERNTSLVVDSIAPWQRQSSFTQPAAPQLAPPSQPPL